MKKFKYIFVSGGVLSGVGKGITASSIGFLLKTYGFRVAPVKCDPYVNIDAGTIRPQEHGEVFVTKDGIETDQDLGHYERFLNQNLTKANYVTTGQIYQEVIRKERNFEYKGEDVEVVPHVPEEMIRRFKVAGHESNADIVIVEIGGTVGEYQNVLFLEAARILKMRDKEDVIHLHVGYLPTPPSLGEMKSKPVQISVRLLNQTGIQPDFLICRAAKPLDKKRKKRIALFCNIDYKDIIDNPYVSSIYQVPLIFKKQGFDKKILKKLKLKPKKTNLLPQWQKLVSCIKKSQKEIVIALAGKYQNVGDYVLPDAYICVLESLRHACWQFKLKPVIKWIDVQRLEKNTLLKNELANTSGIIIPQGWGSRGVEGKIKVAQFARINKIPYLGLCFGMQIAAIEFARNVLGLKKANSQEANPQTNYPVIHIMPNQANYLAKRQYGGTIRLGDWPCEIKPQSILYKTYLQHDLKRTLISKTNPLTVMERHRHRYEFNLKFKNRFEEKGMIIAGTSPDKKLVEAIELDKTLHPFFVGVQFHPEFKSRPLSPHPIFIEFIKAALSTRQA